MARHLDSCIGKAEGEEIDFVRVCLEAAFDPRYWIYLDVRADSALAAVDGLLRKTWLECCGHLSVFRMRGFDLLGSGRQHQLPMSRKAGAVFYHQGQTFSYEYDFGSTTTLKGRVVRLWQGPAIRQRVRLLARNEPLTWVCTTCSAPATAICAACYSEEDGECTFCDVHANHSHNGDIFFLPVVNSPRMGMCGYTGTPRWNDH